MIAEEVFTEVGDMLPLWVVIIWAVIAEWFAAFGVRGVTTPLGINTPHCKPVGMTPLTTVTTS
jgi:hypothetical protein